MKSNIIPTDEFKASCKLVELVTWLENNRHHFAAIVRRPAGSPCRATVLQEMRNLHFELCQWLLHLPK